MIQVLNKVKKGVKETCYFYGFKLTFLMHRVIVPILLGRSVMETLFLFMITEIVAGIFFGYFTQVTHIGEHVEWPTDVPIPQDWAELQVNK
jgi:Na+/H+ antiporter NhaC